MANTFSAQVGDWCRKAEEAAIAVMQNSAQRLVRELNDEVVKLVYDAPPAPTYPKRTGFLRASLVASTEAMPQLVRDNPGVDIEGDPHMGPIIAVIEGWEGDQVLYLGYTSRYAGFVHWGANGRPSKPWVSLVAQRWQEIVSEEAAKVKEAFGL